MGQKGGAQIYGGWGAEEEVAKKATVAGKPNTFF